MANIENKGVALITGASSGIGAVYADRLAKRGYDLLLVARDEARLKALADRLSAETGAQVETLKADLNDSGDLKRVEQRLRSDASITALVNNAGVAAVTPLIHSDVEQLDAMVRLNVLAVTRLASAAAVSFSARGSGAIINIASIVALAPEMLNGVYGASKAYVLALTQSMHHELAASGVRIQAVLPGATATELWDRAGYSVDKMPAEIVMSTDEMVDASLAGFDLGEVVTIPSLPDAAQFEALEAARAALAPNLSRKHAAERYSAQGPGGRLRVRAASSQMLAGGPGAEAAPALDPRTLALLTEPAGRLILRMAWPNLTVMLLQASTGLIETYWVGRLGSDALAGMALVFPPFMLMQMLSVGAMGGGVSSAIARALGAGRREDADRVVFHGVALFAALGLAFSVVMLLFGRPFYRMLGAEGGALEAALAYSNVVFAGNVLLWVMNALASAVRGTGDMLVPAGVVCFGVALLIPLSPLLIYGLGPIPGFGVAGGGLAIVAFNAIGCGFMLWYARSGRSVVRLRPTRLEWRFVADILKVGALASLTSIQTNVIFLVVTALVGRAAGAGALAGYGTGARLEYLLIPLAFGFGAPLVPLVGTNVGAGAVDRAKRIAMTGAGFAFVAAEAIGLAAALAPEAWLRLFSQEPAMIEAGSSYLRIAGPAYGFFAFGMSLYFASQGAGRLGKPIVVTLARTLVAIGGAALAAAFAWPVSTMFVAVSAALVLYGVAMGWLVRSADWRPRAVSS